MTVRQARAAFGAFFLLSAAIVVNALFLQNSPQATAAAKARAAREAARAELERARRLSVDAIDRKRARRRLEQRRLGRAALKRSSGHGGGAGQLRTNAGRAPAAIARELTLTSGEADIVRAIQRELAARNYQPGPIDGVAGLVTRAAIMAYEHDHGLPLSATPSEALLRRIVLGDSHDDSGQQAQRLPVAVNSQAVQVTRTVQQSLLALGYQPGKADGLAGEETARAIREFEMDHNLVQSGRISGHLVAQLARLAGRGRLAVKRGR